MLAQSTCQSDCPSFPCTYLYVCIVRFINSYHLCRFVYPPTQSRSLPMSQGSLVPPFYGYIHHPSTPSSFRCPSPLSTTNPSSISKMLSLQKYYINGMIQHAIFGHWLFLLSIISQRLIQVVVSTVHSLLLLTSIHWMVCIYQFV